ncbi:MAG: hypothetical protein LUG60_10260 [Erysipelotrichaceae bacterium]|nr:hypothetical protein [Erysipelotrichaceae bacterium]
MLGYIKGYTTCTIKKKLIDEESLSELITIDNNIQNKLVDAISNDAYIVGMKKKKILKCIYIFNKGNNILTFSEMIKTDEITDKILKAFEKDIIEDLKIKITTKEISRVDWNNIVIEPNDTLNWLVIGISFGILFGIELDSIMLGICFGAVFGCCYGAIVTHK